MPSIAPDRARAQAWPTRFIRIIVPFAAGGPTDVIALAGRVQITLRARNHFANCYCYSDRAHASGPSSSISTISNNSVLCQW